MSRLARACTLAGVAAALALMGVSWIGARRASAAGAAAPNPLGLTLHADRSWITMWQTANLHGTVDPAVLESASHSVELHWQSGFDHSWTHGTAQDPQAGETSRLAWSVPSLDRNTRFEEYTPPQGPPSPDRPAGYSRVVTVYVLPNVVFSVGPGGARNRFEALYVAYAHDSSLYRRQRMYFYARPAGSRGRFALRGSAAIRYQYDRPTALLMLHSVRRIEVLACVRRRIIADMGSSFFDPSCGRPFHAAIGRALIGQRADAEATSYP